MDSKNTLRLASFMCILPTIVGLILYTRLPGQIPVQWGSGGEVTIYAPKWFSIIGMPLFLLAFNYYCHKKTDRDHIERNYPEVMIVFLKWVMPMISVVGTGLSIASALGNPMSVVGIIGFIGGVMIIFGVYIPNLSNRMPDFILNGKDKNGDKCKRLCLYMGRVFVICGTAVVVLSYFGAKYISVLGIAAAVIISFIISRVM